MPTDTKETPGPGPASLECSFSRFCSRTAFVLSWCIYETVLYYRLSSIGGIVERATVRSVPCSRIKLTLRKPHLVKTAALAHPAAPERRLLQMRRLSVLLPPRRSTLTKVRARFLLESFLRLCLSESEHVNLLRE